MGLRVKFWKKHLQTMGLKVMKQNKITHFSLIKITKMYNDNFLNIFFWVYGWGNEVRGSKTTKQLMGRGGGVSEGTWGAMAVTRSQVTGWNQLGGFTKSSYGKLRLGGMLLASNSRKG